MICIFNTLEKTLEAKLACSDTAVIDNKILNNEIDKLEKELEQIYEQKAFFYLFPLMFR
jgi:dynactin complex subunit